MKGEKILVLSFFLLMMIQSINAATDTVNVDDVFQVNKIINYAKPCFNNGSYCSSAAVCNYTFFFPNNTAYLDNVVAVNRGTNHNYSLAFNELGIYKIDMVCIDGGLKGSETFYAQVTGSGFNNSLPFFLLILICSAGVMVFGFFLKDGWVVILGTFGLFFLGIYTMFNGLADIRDPMITYPISIITLGIAGYIGIRSGMEMMEV